LYTFSFLLLFYFAVFSIVSVRERRWFWATMPHPALLATLAGETVAATALTFAGLPGLAPLPWSQICALFTYAAVSCLLVNDVLKVALLRWRVPAAVA
jgi:hypothetical protein